MKKIIKTDRPFDMLVPVWHSAPDKSLSKLQYDRQMIRVEFPPGEYCTETLEKLVIRGADVTSEEVQVYLAQLGFVPMGDGIHIEGITSGLDPDQECN